MMATGVDRVRVHACEGMSEALQVHHDYGLHRVMAPLWWASTPAVLRRIQPGLANRVACRFGRAAVTAEVCCEVVERRRRVQPIKEGLKHP